MTELVDTMIALGRMRDRILFDLSSLTGGNPEALSSSMPTYSQSVCWKLKMLEHHYTLLTELYSKLHVLDSLGNPEGQNELSVECGHRGGVSITVRDRDSARTLLLLAFDGLVAASVNAVDTFARMLNLLYKLGIRHDRANLPLISEAIPDTSPLGLFFASKPGTGWMAPLRVLRGECQHSDISTVIKEQRDGFGAPLQALHLKEDFCLDGMKGFSVSSFAETARTRTYTFLREAAGVISVSPATACTPNTQDETV